MCSHLYFCMCHCFFFFKHRTAYEMRISDWSSDVCSSDLAGRLLAAGAAYRCFCTTEQLAERQAAAGDQAGYRYDRHCLRLDAAEATERAGQGEAHTRSDERREGKESVSTCRCRGQPNQ